MPAIRNLSLENRRTKLELATLKDRRLKGDLIQMFKIINKIKLYNRFTSINNQIKVTNLNVSRKSQGNYLLFYDRNVNLE